MQRAGHKQRRQAKRNEGEQYRPPPALVKRLRKDGRQVAVELFDTLDADRKAAGI